MTCGFTSFSTVFQSYQDNGRVIIKGCMQWNPVYERKDFCFRRAGTRDGLISRPELNLLSYQDSLTEMEEFAMW